MGKSESRRAGVAMARVVLFLMLIIAVAGAAVFAFLWPGYQPLKSPPGMPEQTCDPLAEECRWQARGGTAALTMSPGDDNELLLELTLPGADSRPMAVLTGENMYMGEYPLMLTASGEPGHYFASFVPPFCTTGGEMIWQMNLRIGQQPLALPFRILFSAPVSG